MLNSGRATPKKADTMVVIMEERATEPQMEIVVARLIEMGMDVHRSTGVTRTVLGVVGQGGQTPADRGARRRAGSRPDLGAIQLASRTFKPERPSITVRDVRIGGDEVIVMAGPCSAESKNRSARRRRR